MPKQAVRIWLHEVDPDGRRVDPRFIEAGYGKEQQFFRYRADKLKDEAVIANLVERAVYRASRAKRTDQRHRRLPFQSLCESRRPRDRSKSSDREL